MFVWAKVANNITACYSVALTLKVIATNIPSTYSIAPQAVCDDFLDINGTYVNNDKRNCYFDLSATKTTIKIYYQQQPGCLQYQLL
jgi:hypothetical protein